MNSSWTFSSKSRMRTIVRYQSRWRSVAVAGSVMRVLLRGRHGCRGRAVPFPVSIAYRGTGGCERQPVRYRRAPVVRSGCNRYWNARRAGPARRSRVPIGPAAEDGVNDSQLVGRAAPARKHARGGRTRRTSRSRRSRGSCRGIPTSARDMRERVLEAVRQLEYEPDFLAQSLRRGATLSVGWVIGDISNPLMAAITLRRRVRPARRGLLDAPHELGERPAISTPPTSGSSRPGASTA